MTIRPQSIAPFAAALLALSWLAGCGQAPSQPSYRPHPSAPRAPMRQPAGPGMLDGMPNNTMPGYGMPAAGAPGAANPAAEAEGQRLKQVLVQALANVSGIESEIKTYSEGMYKQGQRVSELRRSTSRAKLIWAKPDRFRGEVLETTNPIVEGAKLATTDGQNIRVKAKGLLGLIPISVTADDSKLTNNRNHGFKDTFPRTLLSRLTSPEARWIAMGDTTVEGAPARLIAIDGVKRLDGEITREVIGLDPRDGSLRKLTMYAGAKPVVDMTFKGFRWNPRVSASTFSL